MSKKIFYFDTETTGLDCRKNDIIQLAYIIEIDGQIKEEGNFYCQPFNYNTIDNKALEVSKLTVAQIQTFSQPKEIYNKLHTILAKYVDKYDRNDKFSPAGYNINFDIGFLKNFFIKNDDKYYGSFFDYHMLDVYSLAYILEYKGILKLDNYKLVTLAKYFNIDFKAHNALEDIKTTREIFKKMLEYINKKN